jgi:hypothetical protein
VDFTGLQQGVFNWFVIISYNKPPYEVTVPIILYCWYAAYERRGTFSGFTHHRFYLFQLVYHSIQPWHYIRIIVRKSNSPWYKNEFVFSNIENDHSVDIFIGIIDNSNDDMEKILP